MSVLGDYEDRVNLRVGDGPAYLTIMKQPVEKPYWGKSALRSIRSTRWFREIRQALQRFSGSTG